MVVRKFALWVLSWILKIFPTQMLSMLGEILIRNGKETSYEEKEKMIIFKYHCGRYFRNRL